MKKNCTNCNFKTESDLYNFCPICGKELTLSPKTHLYTMGVIGEEVFETKVEMTENEAIIVNRVITALMNNKPKNTGAYYGSVWIEL